MKTFISKYIKKSGLCIALALPMACGLTSCSDAHMAEVNTDDSKSSVINPNSLLTTGLLQTYGDFNLMDTYRSYITGFTQHFAGGWNVTNYAGSVNYKDDQSALLWDRYYTVAIKHLVDGINKTADRPVLNAMLRIHRVYILDIITDTYGDVPCSEAGLGYLEQKATPKYDKQEEIYNFFFKELADCVEQLDLNDLKVTGDVTSMDGDARKWQKYANSLRMRLAMRISDVKPELAQQEFEKAYNDSHGYIATKDDNAFVKYTANNFTLYDGARDFDFRVNALGEILYGQDAESPTFICTTFFNIMKDSNDPRLYRICRHYLNTKRSNVQPDRIENHDLTNEVIEYLNKTGASESPCNPGAAWYNNWVNAPSKDAMPALAKYDASYTSNNYDARMMRPALNIDFEMPETPGILITSAEVNFLLAEAKTKGWNVSGDAETYYENGVRESMEMLNDYYLNKDYDKLISEDEINTFIENNKLSATNPKETINTQAWILHMMNPSEAWANMRRSDYPVILDRTQLLKFDGFPYGPDLHTPTRLKYPELEGQYNTANYNEALQNLGGTDNWHKRMWWDTADQHMK
ncbi:MAG: SusD/RagB family nutrient-binding outer membrane lipoprotein [Prevotella sp.]|nr:SusD/RagB family nutrient-binding outer membrane lipoprotein [Prevotella sp.]